MLTAVLAILSLATPPPALTADEIVARHIDARGGRDALAAVDTVVYSRGRYREGSYESESAFMALARPYLKAVGNPEEAADLREGYDGSTWEWYAAPGVVLRTVGAAAAAGRHNIWPEGPFVDYEDKGTTITYLGDETIDGRPAFRLRMTLRDGFAREYFIDRETFLVTAERFAAPIHAVGEDVPTEERVGDYRRITGVLFPHSYREIEIATGREMSSMTWGSIEVNRKLQRSWFSPPAFTRTAIQDLVEHLYAARADAAAVLWITASSAAETRRQTLARPWSSPDSRSPRWAISRSQSLFSRRMPPTTPAPPLRPTPSARLMRWPARRRRRRSSFDAPWTSTPRTNAQRRN